MEIIKNFGFDPYLFVAQIVNFLIVLYVLKRFLYKPVLDMIKKRHEEVKEGLRQGEEGRMLLEKASAEEKKILRTAQTEAQKIVDGAKIEAQELAARMEENARRRTEKMIADAKQSMAEEATEVEKRLITKVATVAAHMLENSLKDLFSEKDQKELMQKAVKRLKKVD